MDQVNHINAQNIQSQQVKKQLDNQLNQNKKHVLALQEEIKKIENAS